MVIQQAGVASRVQASKRFIFTGLMALAFILLASALVGSSFFGAFTECLQDADIPHQSDRELIDNFRMHRAEFDQLLKMVRKDKALYRVDYNWTAPERPQTAGISQARIDEYRSLMKKLNILRGFSARRVPGPSYIKFITSAQGFVWHGSTKGYFYTEQPPRELNQNLDDVIEKGLYYGWRRIEGNWYLFYEKY